LTPDEQLIVKGDLEKLEFMLNKLKDIPSLDGRMSRQILGMRRRNKKENK